MRVWRWEHLFSTTWVSSIESPVVFVWSLCLIASLKFVLVCYMSYMHMHLLKLLDPDTRCNPQCLSMHCGSAVFIHEQGLLNLCTCGSWAHILAKCIYTILNAHTLCCVRIIDVHHSSIFTSLQLVTFLDYSYTYHTQTNTGTASFLYLDPLTKAMSFTLYYHISDLPYHCTIWSLSCSCVRYNLLRVQLSLVDAYLPSHSPAYLVQYDEEYLNCTSRMLRS